MTNPNLNCIIVHGCPSDAEKALNPETRTYDKHWIPWLRGDLLSQGIHTETPLMPNPWSPDYGAFKSEFEKYPVNANSVLVGHSCGCAFLVRWLGDSRQRIKKLILVAPWKIPDADDASRDSFYSYRVDPGIKSLVGEIVMFTSDNEEGDGKRSLQIFHETLGGKIISLDNHGHYVTGDMGTDKFPELLKEIIE